MSFLLFILFLSCGALSAQDAPAQAEPEVLPAAVVEEMEKSQPEAQPTAEKPVEAPVAEKAPPKAKKEKPAPKAPAGPSAEELAFKARVDSLAAEWSFLKASAEDANSEVRDAVIGDLRIFVSHHADSDLGEQAQLLLAGILDKKGDHNEAAVEWLKFLYEYPQSKLGFAAKRGYLDMVEKRMGRKLKPVLNELAKAPDLSEKSDRLAELLHRLTGQAGDSFYGPLEDEFQRFFTRFAEYPQGDKVLWDLALLREKNSKYAGAMLAYAKLLAVYPASANRPQAQWAVGELYGEHLKEYNKAIDAFSELVERYPDSPQVLPALEKTAKLFEERLKSYDLAVDIHEKIVKLFSKTEGALKAFEARARLEREKLSRPADAIKTYKRLAEDFHTPAGVAALQKAATIARKDLKDYNLEIELRKTIASFFSDSEQAPEELFSAAEVYEDDLKDLDKAGQAYAEVSSKFPTHKLAKKAQDRLAKIEKKKQNP